MGEFPFPFGPFPWWYVLGFFLALLFGGVLLSFRDKLKVAQGSSNYLKERLDKTTKEAIDALNKLASTQRDLESVRSLYTDLIKLGSSEAFDIAVVKHVWEEQTPEPLMRGNEKIVYAEMVFTFAAKRRSDSEIFDIEEALKGVDCKQTIRFLPQKKIGFSLHQDTEDLLSDRDSFTVKFRE